MDGESGVASLIRSTAQKKPKKYIFQVPCCKAFGDYGVVWGGGQMEKKGTALFFFKEWMEAVLVWRRWGKGNTTALADNKRGGESARDGAAWRSR